VRVAVVIGQHPFDVLRFHELCRSLPRIDAYVQHMEEFASSPEAVRAGYDALLFYNMHLGTPTGQGPWYEKRARAALEQLGRAEQGILVLHHAILAFPDWDLWSEVVGIADRRFEPSPRQRIRVEVAQPTHPITRGLRSWAATDELYAMRDAGEGSEVLLTVEHPRSMRTIGWTRAYRRSRVFCFQLGHDAQAYDDPSFRTVVAAGLRWCAGEL
jgi:uncharacterized protein